MKSNKQLDDELIKPLFEGILKNIEYNRTKARLKSAFRRKPKVAKIIKGIENELFSK